MDIHLLQALATRPKVICIEYNAKFPPNVYKVPVYDPHHAWTGTDYMGASLAAIEEVAGRKGYVLVGTNMTGANAFFVRKDLVGIGWPVGGVKVLYNPPRYWLTLDLYSMVGHPADFGPYVDLQKTDGEKNVA